LILSITVHTNGNARNGRDKKSKTVEVICFHWSVIFKSAIK